MDDFAHIVGEDVHFRGRSPSGERGLKSVRPGEPERDAPRRSPPGERGLKELGPQSVDFRRRSLPTRGAWIEIAYSGHGLMIL